MGLLTTAGLAVGSNLLNVGAQALGSKISMGQEKELMRYQNNMNIQNWNRQNEYNLPINEMFRMSQAGLNKNLIYGHGTDVNAGPIPSVGKGSSTFQMPKLDVLGDFMNYVMLDKKRDLMDTQESLYKAQNLKTGAEYSNLLDIGEGIRWDNLIKSETAPYVGELKESEIGKLKAEANKIAKETDMMIFDLGVKNEVRPDIIRSFTLKNNEVSAHIAYLKSQGRLNDQQIQNLIEIKNNLIKDGIIKGLVVTEKQLELQFQQKGIDKGLGTVLRPLLTPITPEQENYLRSKGAYKEADGRWNIDKLID